MRHSNNLENKTPSDTYWRVLLVCKKVQANSSLEPPLENYQNTYFSKHLSMAASVSTCNKSHTYIWSPAKMLIFIVYYYSFLPYEYNLSHRLTELYKCFPFYLIKLFYLIRFSANKDKHMLMQKS